MAASTGSGPSPVPGEPKTMGTTVIEAAAGLVQGFGPVRQIGTHLCAFHFYAEDMSRQVEAHHFCSCLNNEVRQCLIYDSDKPDARLIGVEFVISERLFGTLPEEEKKLWHSHEYEVKSGILLCPEMAPLVERPVMQALATTFGKTWHFWEVDKGHALPLGVPKLMGAFYRDGQIDQRLVADVEKRYGLSVRDRKETRADLAGPVCATDPLQKHFEAGKGYKLALEECSLEHEGVVAQKGA